MPFAEYPKRIAWFRDWLVGGEILGQTQEPGSKEVVVTIHITHVYAGPSILKGQTFEAHFSLDNSHAHFYDTSYLDTFIPGRNVITSVRWLNRFDPETGEDKGHLDYSRSYGFPLPTILDGSSQAREVKGHAQAVEAVYRAPAEQRNDMMRQYAKASLPITTRWALSAIEEWTTDKGYEFAQQLAEEPDLPIWKLGFVIRKISDRKQDVLQTDAEKLNMLIQRLILMPQAADGGGQGGLQLLSCGWNFNKEKGVIPSARFVEFCQMFMGNATVSDKTRLDVVMRFGQLNLPKADAFSFWTSVLCPQAPGAAARKTVLAEAAATQLLANAPWTAEQKEQLSALQSTLQAEAALLPKEQASRLTKASEILGKANAVPNANNS